MLLDKRAKRNDVEQRASHVSSLIEKVMTDLARKHLVECLAHFQTFDVAQA